MTLGADDSDKNGDEKRLGYLCASFNIFASERNEWPFNWYGHFL